MLSLKIINYSDFIHLMHTLYRGVRRGEYQSVCIDSTNKS